MMHDHDLVVYFQYLLRRQWPIRAELVLMLTAGGWPPEAVAERIGQPEEKVLLVLGPRLPVRATGWCPGPEADRRLVADHYPALVEAMLATTMKLISWHALAASTDQGLAAAVQDDLARRYRIWKDRCGRLPGPRQVLAFFGNPWAREAVRVCGLADLEASVGRAEVLSDQELGVKWEAAYCLEEFCAGLGDRQDDFRHEGRELEHVCEPDARSRRQEALFERYGVSPELAALIRRGGRVGGNARRVT